MNSFSIFLRLGLVSAGVLAALSFVDPGSIAAAQSSKPPVRVLVWDERQPAQKQAYTNFLGNEIATYLKAAPGLSVESRSLDDPGQGLRSLNEVDVLVWWGHQRQQEITSETALDIVARIRSGRLGLIALHSAHWSQPFVEAMRARARQDALAGLSPEEQATAVLIETNLFAAFRTPPQYHTLLTPTVIYRKPSAGPITIQLTLPNCCFPAYRADGKPSQVRVLRPEHPLAGALPQTFTIEQTEMYDEPFHVPAPDQVVLEERWAGGEWFRSGCVWNIGQGRVVYFRPGHETFPVYKNPAVLKFIENAVRWLGDAHQ